MNNKLHKRNYEKFDINIWHTLKKKKKKKKLILKILFHFLSVDFHFTKGNIFIVDYKKTETNLKCAGTHIYIIYKMYI